MKKIVIVLGIVSFLASASYAQKINETKKKKTSVHVDIQDGANPDIYVDGKKFDFPMALIDKDYIKTVNVIKGEQALKEYNAKHGVILITTKEESLQTMVDNNIKEDLQPMVIVDGVESDRKALEELSPDDIESINIIKDEAALKKYNAPNGVVVVKTKKAKKKD